MKSSTTVPVMGFGDPNATRQMQTLTDVPLKTATDSEMAAFSAAFAHHCTHLVDDRFTVVVFGRTSPPTSGALVKYVAAAHRPAVTNDIRLASGVSYGHDEQHPGADVRFGSPLWLRQTHDGDSHEGGFTLTEEFLDEICPGLTDETDARGLFHAFFNPGWIFCSALVPDQRTMDVVASRFAGRDAVYIREAPSAFAARLGIQFGRHQLDKVTNGTTLYKIVLHDRDLRAAAGAIAVFHGPVEYMDEARRNAYLSHLLSRSKRNSRRRRTSGTSTSTGS